MTGHLIVAMRKKSAQRMLAFYFGKCPNKAGVLKARFHAKLLMTDLEDCLLMTIKEFDNFVQDVVSARLEELQQ